MYYLNIFYILYAISSSELNWGTSTQKNSEFGINTHSDVHQGSNHGAELSNSNTNNNNVVSNGGGSNGKK